MGKLTVIVPPDLTPGDTFMVVSEGRDFAVTVPEGVAGNVAIEVELPLGPTAGSSSSDGPATERVEVTIPDGVRAGEPFTVAATWGGLFEVIVPDGLGPGDLIEIELPTGLAECTELGPAPSAEASSSRAVAMASGTYSVGEHVQVLRTDGSWSPAEVIDWDATSDTYTVRLTATNQLKYMMSDSEVQPRNFQVERCGEHFVGRRVQVPTVGAESRDEVMGEIRSFDPVNRTYDILMDTGLFKRGVQAEAIRVKEGAKPPPAFLGPSLALAQLGS
jgi:hypothetical protein